MRTTLKVEKPGEVEFTLSITMKADDWAKLREQLGRSYPSFELTIAINNLLSQVQRVFYRQEPE